MVDIQFWPFVLSCGTSGCCDFWPGLNVLFDKLKACESTFNLVQVFVRHYLISPFVVLLSFALVSKCA